MAILSVIEARTVTARPCVAKSIAGRDGTENRMQPHPVFDGKSLTTCGNPLTTVISAEREKFTAELVLAETRALAQL